MIEVNLLPSGGKTSSGRRRLSVRLPNFRGRIPRGDRWTTGAAAAVLIAFIGSGWFYFSTSGEAEELEFRVESAVRDSIRFADIVAQSALLQARADSIAARVSVIQEIDQGRYVWPHLLDEVARAMPEYAWLTRLFQIELGGSPIFQIEGRAGTYFALTTLMENLEASPFIEGVQLIASEQIAISNESGGDRLLYEFILEASGNLAPPELVETVPLFGSSVVPSETLPGE